MTIKIDHIGIAVKSIADALAFYQDTLGIKLSKIEEVSEQKVRVAFLPVGDIKIELLESTSEDGPVARFIEKNGEGVQHVAFQVENIEETLKELKKSGVRLIDEMPRIGANGSKIAFIHPKASFGTLIEICERK
ncbi:MAG: methylmalonyl-CoA epimerase [Peptococcaceae bacterium]|nr:methylmalonyl-CoA epimerase [Peptococcaceae bacterium]